MNKEINVLMVGSDLTVKGGMTTVVENFLDNKFKKNINIKYVPTHIEKNIFIQIIFFIKALLKITYLLMFGNISIIHEHLSEKGSFYRKYLVSKLGKLFNKKVIIHMHGAEFKDFYDNSPERLKNKILSLLKYADVVLVLGNEWNKYVLSLDKKINTQIFRNSVEIKNKLIERKEDELNILFLAVLIERKGIIDLIDSARLLAEKGVLSKHNIKFTIAGSGIAERTCKNKVKNYNLDKFFEFKGWVKGNEKYKLLEKSQIFVLPSYNEGLPVAILEAMSYGIPVISTNVGSIEDVVKDDINGFIINPGDVKSLADRIEELIKDKKLWNKFSLNSNYIICNEYDCKKYFNNIEKLYLKLGN